MRDSLRATGGRLAVAIGIVNAPWIQGLQGIRRSAPSPVQHASVTTNVRSCAREKEEAGAGRGPAPATTPVNGRVPPRAGPGAGGPGAGGGGAPGGGGEGKKHAGGGGGPAGGGAGGGGRPAAGGGGRRWMRIGATS